MKLKNVPLHKLIEILIITAGVSVMLLALTVWIFDLTSYFNGDWEEKNLDPKEAVSVNVEKEFSLDDLEEVKADISFSDIHVVTGKGDKILVKFTGAIVSRPELQEPYLISDIKGKTLSLKPAMGNSYSVRQSTLLLEITVPESFLKKMQLGTSSGDIRVEGNVSDALVVDSTSGSASVSGFQGSSLVMDSSSGEISVNDSTTGKLSVETTSGDMSINSSRTESFAADTSSGDLEVDSLESRDNRVETTSGKAELNDLSGNLDYKSSSGSLTVYFSAEGEMIKADTTSGDVLMSFDSDTGFTIKADTTSGDFSIDFPLTLEGEWSDDNVQGKVGDGSGMVRISTSSGDISIVKR